MSDPIASLHPQIVNNIDQSERDGGMWLKDVAVGDKIRVRTVNTTYVVERVGADDWLISGHHKFCPEPTPVKIAGSTWGGSMLKMRWIGVGMYMEFYVEKFSRLTTSEVRSVERLLSEGEL